MKKLIALVIITPLVTLFSVTYGQSQFTGWLASFNTIKISPKKSIHLDVQIRSTDEIQQLRTFLFRPGINFHWKNNLTFTVGYAYISNKSTIGSVTDFVPEQRLWEQLLYTHKLKNISLTHRFRFEQRFLATTSTRSNSIETDGYVMSGRLRYFIRNIAPLKKQTSFTKGMFAALQNEVFVNVIDKYKVNGKVFDQNRLYLAMGYRLNTRSDLEIGYMNQYINGKGKAFTNNHILQLAAYLRL